MALKGKPTTGCTSQVSRLALAGLLGLVMCFPVQAQARDDSPGLLPTQKQDGEQKMSNLTQAVLEHNTEARNMAASMGQAALTELVPLLQDQDSAIRMRAVMALGGVDILITKTALFNALDDADFNVRQSALAEIEQQQAKLSVPLLVGLLDKLKDDNSKNRIILVLGKRLPLTETAPLEKYCSVEQSPIVALHSMAALAKIGVEQRRKQFAAYLLSIKQDNDALHEAFQLVEYIEQPWLVATLRQLLSNKEAYRSLGGHVPGFPTQIRVCDQAVMLIARLLPQLKLSFKATLYANFSDEQIAEISYATSNLSY